MARRTRIPGPIVRTQTLGNSRERTIPGVTPWRSIDVNDGNWTLYDPNSTIVSATTGATGMRLVWDKNETAHRFTNGKMDSGRWHTKLKHPNGRDLTWADYFNVEILTELTSMNANTPSDDKSGITFGLAQSDITNSTSTQIWIGGAHYFVGSETERLRTYVGGKDGWSNNANTQTTGVLIRIAPPIDDDDTGDTNPRTLRLNGTLLDTNKDVVSFDGVIAPARRTSEWTSTDNVYLFLSPNWTTTIADPSTIDNADSTWKMWYRVTITRDGLNPQYLPGGGVSGL